MTRKSAVKKKAAIRKFENGTQEWLDHQDQLYCAKLRKWETDLEKTKQKLSPLAAEKYLNRGMDVLEHFARRVMFASPGGMPLIEPHRFFLEPALPKQRQYEALRAFFVEGHPSQAVAQAFGYTPAFRDLQK